MAHTPPLDSCQRGAQVPANGARGGHPRTVPHAKMSSEGRTELQISLSGAKNVKEAAGDARFCVAPQKTCENIKKPIFFSKKNRKKFKKQICSISKNETLGIV